TLHRDQPLDFIGVRNTDTQGNTIGEHCFVGLFTNAATSTPLARLPFARGRVAKVLGIAGVRQEGFRAEKFLEILQSLPRSQTLVADGPLARVYLIAQAARYPLDLESDIQKPLLGVLDGWHDRFSLLIDGVDDVPARNALRKLLPTLPVNFVAATAPEVAF